jgi:hypothetical protein
MAQQVESHCPGFVVFLAEQIDPAQRMEIFFSVQLIQAAPELPDALIQKFRRMKVFFGKLLHTGSSSKRTNVRDFALKKAECSPQIFSSGPASLSGVPTIPYMFYCTVGIRLCQ